MDKSLKNNKSKLETIISLMIAFFLTGGFTAKIFASLGIIEEGMVPVILIIVLLIAYIANFLHRNTSYNLNKNNIIIVYLLTILLLINVSVKGLDSFSFKYLIDFFAFGLIGYLLILLPFNPKKVIFFVMIIGNLIIINPSALLDFAVEGYYYERLTMGTTYALIPSISATIIYFFFLKNKRFKIVQLISYLSNFYLFYLVLTKGNRGAVLTIIILLLLVIYIKISKMLKGKKLLLLPIIYSLIITTVVFFILNSAKILYKIYGLLQEQGIEVAAIIKTVNMLEKNGFIGVLNARDVVYERAFTMISNSPIIGNGIGSYGDDTYVSFPYPHNLFLQLFVEGGLLFIIPSTFIFIIILYLLLKPWNDNEQKSDWRYFILFLFILCIPRLMISSYFWRDQSFWLLIFISLMYIQKFKLFKKMKSPIQGK
ncbi:O-antigen ligase family protein [Lederbergia sp. NSJ-179]|uniref:O-antigen ligase family protein n=1 Tax=Lederbergia sp. NSJ-179 TaxID=2931402 RepID=UPI001FD38715|nr:O-antigen ligase family protein [Lederbergia sp. NSJ-179]MCJ7840675.1 O-antigen ligase family protein [Lederbergia sp. NSJ-179]